MAIESVSEETRMHTSPLLPDSAQWGLASLFIGGILIVSACVLMVFSVLFWRTGPVGIPMSLASAGGIIGVTGVFALGIASLIIAVRGWQMAYARRDCPAFALAGTLTSLAGLVAWLIAGIVLLCILHFFA